MDDAPAPDGSDERRVLDTGTDVVRDADGTTTVPEDGEARLTLEDHEVEALYHLVGHGADSAPTSSDRGREAVREDGGTDRPAGRRVPTGDPAARSTEPGALYADPAGERVVRFSDPDAWDGYRVEIWRCDGDEVTSRIEHWETETIDEFVASDRTEYLASHCVDDCRPYGVFTAAATGRRCDICDRPLERGRYEGTDQSYPGLVCADYDSPTDCSGHEKVTSLTLSGAYVLIEDYVTRRFG